ncbi:NAD(P)H-dependent flavin oxidoreductase [Phenylobacterium sp.]|uniref:NAD(P)H-dependent flavin oxidoreductase n=1 Tax=Phenylobacterium sp. TaxID=1871053 RepID=UPI0035AECB13
MVSPRARRRHPPEHEFRRISMSLHTPLCDLLGVKHPIMLAGMGGVSYAELAAAVSNAGGYGVLGMAGRTPEFIRDEMRKVKSLTDKPFGVDLLAASPESLTASVEIIIEEGASSFVAGLGVPMPIMEKLKKAGLKVMVVCGAVKHAVKAEQAGCDAVICQGGEGGGHTGLVGTMPLVAQAVEAVKIPVVAAGGLYDGRGLAAALALGATGVWMGTRFIASTEAHAGELYRQAILEAADEDTIRTRSYSGKPMRVKKNPYVEEWETRPQDIQPFPMQAMLSSRAGVMGGIGGQIEGLDPDRSCFAMGQSAGGVHEVLPAAEIVAQLLKEAEAAIDRVAKLRAGVPA